ncbi:hypothetical protein [Curtobacterium flaccumfaciens]
MERSFRWSSDLSSDAASDISERIADDAELALRQAIWHKPEPDWPVCGIPDVLYTDHGSDFTSHRLGDTAAVLHRRIIHSQVPRPQGRGKIERFFGTINTELHRAFEADPCRERGVSRQRPQR